MAPYAVLLKEPERYRPVELARALAAIRGACEVDLFAEAKACWGVLAAGAEAEARGLAERLGAAGLAAVAVPASLVEEPPAAQEVVAWSWTARALTAAGEGAAAGRALPWSQATLVAAAVLPVRVEKTVTASEGPGLGEKAARLGLAMATGLPLPGPKERVVRKTVREADLAYYLDVVFAEAGVRLRVDGLDFDYSCLGARKGYQSFGNFRELAAEAAARSTGAVRNRGTRFLLEGRPVREMGYESLADLDGESRWLLTLRALKLL